MSSKQAVIPSSALAFLEKLKTHNYREWFNEHKDEYLKELRAVEGFADALLAKMNEHDLIETPTGKSSLHRIYRDTRFSKDKTPYRTEFSGGFKRATKLRRGGYYFRIEPGNSFVGGGFWGPNAADLKRIRDDISYDAAPLRKILKSKQFVSNFGVLQGEQLKTAPKGYDPANEAIDLLRYKQFLLIRRFTDEEVLSSSFIDKVNYTFNAMRPFLDYMSEVLTMDENGEML
jgi:uncharacterized protein (TIGR02453 family)